jgi:ribosomal protein S18 acetylase RimI-like enzyme
MPNADANFSIRPWTTEDIPQLATLAGELGYTSTAGDVERRLRQMGAHSIVLVAAKNDTGAVVGWIELAVVTHLTSDSCLEICGLVVSKETRSAGIGSLLVAAAEQQAAAMGMQRLRVRSNVVRDRAHKFYERLKFETVKTSRVFEKKL